MSNEKREIKFRVWNEQSECFHYWGFDVNKEFGGFAGIPNSSIMDINYCRDNSEQYTGLKDKNGVEIYEGDKTATGDDGIYEIVQFHQGKFGWMFFEEGDGEPIEFDSMDALLLDRVEIIGNIHTNK